MSRAALPPLPATVLGDGPPILFCPGFAMTSRVYHRTLTALAERSQLIVPDLLGVPGRWRYRTVQAALATLLDEVGVDRVSVIAHSFGGGIALGFAARQPARVVELVFSDSLGVTARWRLAASALSGLPMYWRLATPGAIRDFTHSAVHHPARLGRAGWWAFRADMSDEVAAVRRAGIACHVLWAQRDVMLRRRDGMRFAAQLHASFDVVHGWDRHGPTDHDWVFRHPELFVAALDRLNLKARAATEKVG
jgi:pimeloyl-ACP methyl ester carboxylesterase